MVTKKDQQHFFEALALLRLCRRGTGKRTRARDLRTHDQKETNLWHQVLDELSWLADSLPAGFTVTSMAGIEYEGEKILLLAANNDISSSTLQHLKNVLDALQKCPIADKEDLAMSIENIFCSSVEHSWKKVVNYRKQLSRCIAKAVSELLQDAKSPEETELLKTLDEFGTFEEDRPELCRYAYYFRHKPSKIVLEKKCDNNCLPFWHSIRHLIGRLGSWYKSAKTLVAIAAEEPHLLDGFKIQVLKSVVLPFSKPTVEESSFESALMAACPSFDPGKVFSALERIQGCNTLKLHSKFQEILSDSNLKPFIHAEVLIADHIFVNDLQFVRDDRYIGCSKPSCYSCELYFELHPGKLCKRPSHGNLWIKWSSSAQNLNTHYGNDLFNEMIRRIRQDIVTSLFAQQVTKRLPDSSSGLSRSFKTTAAKNTHETLHDPGVMKLACSTTQPGF